MSEYMESHAVSRLIGSPPGYVGHDEGGQLTEAVRRKPYSVILFDEIEKAHRDVFNVFLQILDDGRLTDGKGRTVSFKNAVIIMTSNLGSSLFHENLAPEELDKRLSEVLKSQFRPEFINRIDDVIPFAAMSDEMVRIIAGIVLSDVRSLLAERRIDAEFEPSLIEELVRVGYDPEYGARPLKRAVTKTVLNPLSEKLLRQEFVEGEKISIGFGDGTLKVTKR